MTMQPDQGLAQIIARFGGGQQPPAGGAGAGAELDVHVFARLADALNANTAAIDRKREAEQRKWAQLHPIPINTQASNAAGVLADPDRWGPKAGFAWRIDWLSLLFGAGTTQVTVWDSAAQIGAPPIQATSSGVWEPKRKIMLPGQQLVVVSVGGGVTVTGEAWECSLDYIEALT